MMRPDARQRMLDILRAALRTAELPGATPEAPGGFRRAGPVDEDLIARFVRELTALGGVVHQPAETDTASIARVLATIAEGGSGKRILMWDDEWIPVPGLRAALAADGFEIDRQSRQDMASNERREELASADLGLTGADAALAETGSLVLVSGPGRGRLASLLPPLHVAVVERTRVMPSLPDLFLDRPDLATAGSNLVCITGPSRTADIEHTLSRGVHGPKEVHVIVV
jgi:L-lactate dehydrogenase complex protein LldG